MARLDDDARDHVCRSRGRHAFAQAHHRPRQAQAWEHIARRTTSALGVDRAQEEGKDDNHVDHRQRADNA